MNMTFQARSKTYDSITHPDVKGFTAGQIFGSLRYGLKLKDWPEECHAEVEKYLAEHRRRAEAYEKMTDAEQEEKFRRAVEIVERANERELREEADERLRIDTLNNKKLQAT